MIILSWNVHGLGSLNQRAIIKRVIRHSMASLVLIQVTKISSLEDCMVRQIAGPRFFNWVGLNAVGSSGGILLVWDSQKLAMLDHWTGLFSVSAVVRDVEINKEWIISSIYGLTGSGSRQ